ncbi:hypothetical protein JTE90_002334 [Oedothorax gibbosus]|uniref:Uncharacterized protein n=1 Tax=Oedothorax gibbosus TaxID=931172 RepID=A0AAV6UK37_9ARAC|nr:hypothetical protein JTE90_002334 [Oedothorax gibbosus]
MQGSCTSFRNPEQVHESGKNGGGEVRSLIGVQQEWHSEPADPIPQQGLGNGSGFLVWNDISFGPLRKIVHDD